MTSYAGVKVQLRPITVAARAKAWVCDRSLPGITGFESCGGDGGHGCLSLLNVVKCQVEVSATGRSLFHRNPAECGVSNGALSENVDEEEAWPNGTVEPRKKNIYRVFHDFRA